MKYTTSFYAMVYPAWVEQPTPTPGLEPRFDTARGAWAHLKKVRWEQEEQHPGWTLGEPTDTYRYLDYNAGTEEFGPGACEFGNLHEDWPLAPDGTGMIVGATPGVGDGPYDDQSGDRGIVYAVVKGDR